MNYWRKENFEGLLSIADILDNDPRCALFTRYLRLREKGLRQEAFAELSKFITQALAWSYEDRRDVVHRLKTLYLDWPDVHDLIPTTLYRQVVLPTLNEWVDREPQNPIPLRLRALSLEDLRQAVHLEPEDFRTRKRLATRLLMGIGNSTHELPYGYIGSPIEDLAELDEVDEVDELLRDIPADDRIVIANAAAQLRGRVQAYIDFTKSDTTSTFKQWLEETGREFR